MSKSILVPTDFSDCSAAAYSYAALLAEKSDATIYLLHVLDIPSPSLSANGNKETRMDTHFMMEMMQLTKARMGKIRNGKTFKGADVEEIIELGSVPEMILKAAQKYKIDMIVMGTHGRNGLQEKFIGTNAEKIVRNAGIPVLSVKHAMKNPKLDTILFAADFSKETEEILPAVSHIAKLLKAKLVLAKIITLNNFETSSQTEKLIEKFRGRNKAFEFSTSIYYADSKEEGIRRSAGALGADMIALGTHGKNGLSHLFQGSIAEDVVSHASLPVFTVNFHRLPATSGWKVQGKNIRKYDSDLLYQIPSV
ncbi:MAG: universal stress protein [Bacteroidetes bacterium]|nr:MAG: universal stress protein [Bacteroidota bacterium]